MSATAVTVQSGTSLGIVITPNTSFPGFAQLMSLVGSLDSVALVLCVASVILGAGIWGLSEHVGSSRGGAHGRHMVLAGVLGGLLVGLGPQIVTYVHGL